MPKQSDFSEFLPNMILAMERPPSFYARLVSVLVMLFVAVTLLWLYFAKVDIIVTAQGKVVPSGKIKLVQAADSGIVRNIFVRDGQPVKAGDVLIEFDSTVSDADSDQLLSRLNQARLTMQRHRIALGEEVTLGEGVGDQSMVSSERAILETSGRAGEEEIRLLAFERAQLKAAFDAAKFELKKLDGLVTYNEEQATRKKRFAAEGLIAGAEAQEAEFRMLDSQRERTVQVERVSEAKERYSSAAERVRAKRTEQRNALLQGLAEANVALKEAEQSNIKANKQLTHQKLIAPVDGIVQQLGVHTIGAVVSRADQLLVLIPSSDVLEVEAKILNKDIGFVDTEQNSNVKIDAFEYTRYGQIEGQIDWVASDSVLDKEKGPIYPARIKLAQTTLPRKVNNRIAQVLPGMNVTVDVVIGQRRLIEYFSGPLLRYKDESLTER